jgi:hypothetical protein
MVFNIASAALIYINDSTFITTNELCLSTIQLCFVILSLLSEFYYYGIEFIDGDIYRFFNGIITLTIDIYNIMFSLIVIYSYFEQNVLSRDFIYMALSIIIINSISYLMMFLFFLYEILIQKNKKITQDKP